MMALPMFVETHLRSHPLFSRLTSRQVSRVSRGARALHLRQGERLFEYGQAAERSFLVARGLLKLHRLSPEGAEKIIELTPAGSLFAEALLFLDNPHYPLSAEALTASEVLALDNKILRSVLEESTAACLWVNMALNRWVERLLDEINALTLQNATLRVVNYLLRLLPEGGGNGMEITLPAAKHLIASRLSVTPETLSRILNNLNARGLISVHREIIRIHDVNALRACSERADCV
jgi:CRP-like cAMP-binding protein